VCNFLQLNGKIQLRKLGVNSEVTRLPHRVLWTETFFGVKKITMHHASRSAKPPFAFVQHFSTLDEPSTDFG